MALLDLLGRRWGLCIVWELRDVGIVEHGDEGYALTAEGVKLLKSLEPLEQWSRRWERRTKKRV